ncbi:MAG: hypothetical protein ACRC5T_03330 [Cetobacterium sp.]
MIDNTIPAIPVDEAGLAILRDAVNSAWTVDEDGNHYIEDGFSLLQYLNFLSGYDPSLVVDGEYPDPVYSTSDVILALIKEIERLRTVKEIGNDFP